ncbi:MAG TPA: type II toxin-antitoxin system VapC family toxin [Pyrinomonadaceae bacterium]|nr:type II toxin-antitoxin system VapC family toxin [Pyrinomonadaceae bacterium]
MLERQTGAVYLRLQAKLDEFPAEEITTTIITFEEQFRGWMSYLAKMRSIDEQVFAYQTLKQYFDYFKTLTIIDFDTQAAEIYRNLKSQKIRIGSMDLKIASIAITNKAILVSRNLKDFEQVPDLSVQDWTR